MSGRGKGFSLVEGIIAVALLTTGLVVFFQILQIGFRYRGQAEQRATASVIAAKTITEIRLWARTGNNFDDWTPYTDVRFPDPEEVGYTVEVKSQDALLGSPDTETEQQWDAAEQRFMTGAFRQVDVKVSWESSSGKDHVYVSTLVGDGRREWDPTRPIVVTGGPSGLVGPDEEVTFTAEGFDSAGNRIPGLFFVWSVEATSGNGTVRQNRSGSTATFQNVYKFKDGSTGYTGGTCRVMATARYRGVEQQGYSTEIELLP